MSEPTAQGFDSCACCGQKFEVDSDGFLNGVVFARGSGAPLHQERCSKEFFDLSLVEQESAFKTNAYEYWKTVAPSYRKVRIGKE